MRDPVILQIGDFVQLRFNQEKRVGRVHDLKYGRVYVLLNNMSKSFIVKKYRNQVRYVNIDYARINSI